MSADEQQKDDSHDWVCLAHDERDIKYSPLRGLRDGNMTCWYTSMSSPPPSTDQALKAHMHSEIVSWDTLFVPARPDLLFRKVRDYLSSSIGCASKVQYVESSYGPIFGLTAHGSKAIRSLLVYMKQSLDKRVVHEKFELDDIYVNNVGEILVQKPTSKFEGPDEATYTNGELAKFHRVIRELCTMRKNKFDGQIPSDVVHMLSLLTAEKWKYWKFVLNHPCFWPPQHFEGKVSILRERCKPRCADNYYIRKTLKGMDNAAISGGGWDKKLEDACFEDGKQCMISQLRYSRVDTNAIKYDGQDQEHLLIFMRNLFTHCQDYHGMCHPRHKCVPTGDKIYKVLQFLFPCFMTKLAFKLYSGSDASKGIKEFIVS